MKKLAFAIFVLALPVCLYCQVAGKRDGQKSGDLERNRFLNETKSFIERHKSDRGIYCGEGIANIGDDLGQANITAKGRALRDLAEKIKVQIRSDITAVLSATTRSTEENYGETIREEIVEKTQLYSDQIFMDVNERTFPRYPEIETLTYFVWISRGEYEAKVKKDLNDKKSLVRQTIRNGDEAFSGANYVAALTHWVNAKYYKESFFGHLPLQDDLDNDNRVQEVTAYLDKEVALLVSNVHLSFLGGDIFYDVKGRLSQKPVLLANFTDEKGGKRAIANLPLKVDFVSGSGKVQPHISSGSYGETSLPISWIDPANPSTTIRVGIDTVQMSGLSSFALPPLPWAGLTMTKVKTVALSVSFFDGSATNEPDGAKNEIRSDLLNSGFSVISSFIGGEVTPAAIEKAGRTNADYLLLVHVKTVSSGAVGGFDNMFAANCVGLLSLYKLPNGGLVRSESLPSAQGFGVSNSGAAWDAFGKMKHAICQKSVTLLRSIK